MEVALDSGSDRGEGVGYFTVGGESGEGEGCAGGGSLGGAHGLSGAFGAAVGSPLELLEAQA